MPMTFPEDSPTPSLLALALAQGKGTCQSKSPGTQLPLLTSQLPSDTQLLLRAGPSHTQPGSPCHPDMQPLATAGFRGSEIGFVAQNKFC